ncbi:hypothetical protein PHYPSEUDO_013909 [Phytophthora pseudosyringae]|uniref:Transmembrane protein n=1 Tax=Phytophthora pseudosyringae TaxID=221518 RepID=A0A8T1W7B6_9STRA|nr:hypothetical protein PHYPSEUDO_013909 [Phytophthora pseudosyringae]
MDSSSFETTPTLENETKATDQALGTTVLLAAADASLSKQIIVDYFTSDGPRGRRLDSSNCVPARSILDESSGDEELLRPFGDRLANASEARGVETNSSPVETPEERSKGMLEEMFTWEIAVSVLVVVLALAHCMWMWNLVELSALRLEFED